MLGIYLICLWFFIGAVTGIYVIKTDNGAVKIRDLPFIASFTVLGLVSVILLFWTGYKIKLQTNNLKSP